MSISAAIAIGVTVTDTLSTTDAPLVDSADAVMKESLKTTSTLNASSTPDAETHCAMSVPMTVGAVTIDFTALTKRGGATLSASGKNVRAVVLANPATNANDITIVEGASNGLALLGAAFSVTLKPGHKIAAYLDDDGPLVGGTDKTIDVTGTGSQPIELLAVFG